jgi:sugar phosphate isomerase/epimerase
MRLGGPVFGNLREPDHWIAALRKAGYTAAYCPLTGQDDSALIQAFADAARKADIVIAETGAWSNPLSADAEIRLAALHKCQDQLALADEIGALCCVNIAGARGQQWDGPHPDNLTQETFDMIVETTRAIIDAVKPRRAFFTLETMPWIYPDSADSYVALIEAIDRKQFAVHLDPVNLINSPQRFFENGALIRECIAKLGAHIKSCHAKDITLESKLTVHLDEVRPGLGKLDYRALLQELDKLDADVPVMLEHLSAAQDYVLAGEYVRSVANEIGVHLK